MSELTPRQIEIADAILSEIARVAELDFLSPDAKMQARLVIIDFFHRAVLSGENMREQVNIGRETVIKLEVVEKVMKMDLCFPCKQIIALSGDDL
jgi:hypothetical protein